MLYLLLPINDAPALWSNGSIYGFAGRGSLKQLAIVAALFSLWSVLIFYGLLQGFGGLRGRGCADDRCRSSDRGAGSTRCDGQNTPPGNPLSSFHVSRPVNSPIDKASLTRFSQSDLDLTQTPAELIAQSGETMSLQITEIRRHGFNLCLGQIMRDRLHDGGVVWLGLVLASFLLPVR